MRMLLLLLLLSADIMGNWFEDAFVSPAYADAASIDPRRVAYVESRGMTPKAKATPGLSGEIGTYQITPVMFQDLQRLLPQKYSPLDFFSVASDDNLAKTAMQDYMSLLETHYAPHYGIQPTDENLLQMFNVGPKAFSRGKRNPGYVETYRKAR